MQLVVEMIRPLLRHVIELEYGVVVDVQVMFPTVEEYDELGREVG